MNDAPPPVGTRTLQVPGARLHYEVRGSGPLLLMIPGAPADAGALAGLAACLADRFTVVTYDQRGLSRSVLTEPPADSDVAVFGDDAHRLLDALGEGPAYVVGNSGGALTALDLAARHPGQVRALVVHEPPLPELLTDREHWRAVFQDVHDTYREQGAGAAMGKFVAAVNGPGSAPPAMPDPSRMPPEALETMGRVQGNLDHFLAHVLLPVLRFTPDTAALRSGPVPITVGIGESSGDGVPALSARALAERLGVEPLTFPGDHQGLATDAPACAETIHAVLA
ncbi:alpha/beta fold hydrolase [Actinorugispora endophytica]|uniref:Pimeloyl-ACP methyl ester carboxylesterase n=1 Tax=Actinorugispora endophytica TaxID=1605990 RepID=A0A4V6PWN9_9ACTN|nr:alpha/beta hydrolase [Actinorugispora endophytica]TDQ46127.1 pimeloyl-ACP methyl ester carboxylesterase [Actinorugispora endophytica]